MSSTPTLGSAPPRETHLMCPSAQPEMEGSRVLGVVGGTADAPDLAYLNQYLPVTDDLIAMAQPAKPTQVMRFAAPCQEKACCHFDGANCNLVTRIVQILPAVTELCRLASSGNPAAGTSRKAATRASDVLRSSPRSTTPTTACEWPPKAMG